MNVEQSESSRLSSRLPQWRWLYGGWAWAVALMAATEMSGLSSFVLDEVSPNGRLSSPGRLALGLSLLAAMVLGILVQRQWPSSLAYRLFVPAIALAISCAVIVLPFGQTFIDSDGLVTVGVFLAWVAGVVLADPMARMKPQRQPSPTTRRSSPSATTATVPSESVRATSIPASKSDSTS